MQIEREKRKDSTIVERENGKEKQKRKKNVKKLIRSSTNRKYEACVLAEEMSDRREAAIKTHLYYYY